MLMKSNRLFTMGSPYLIVLVGPTCHDHLISSTVPPMVQIWSFGYGQACVCRKPTHVAPDDPVLVLLQPSSEPQSPKSRADRGSEHEIAASVAVPWLVARGGRSARRRPPPPSCPTRQCTTAPHPRRRGRWRGYRRRTQTSERQHLRAWGAEGDLIAEPWEEARRSRPVRGAPPPRRARPPQPRHPARPPWKASLLHRGRHHRLQHRT
jgi:hypothetical protein